MLGVLAMSDLFQDTLAMLTQCGLSEDMFDRVRLHDSDYCRSVVDRHIKLLQLVAENVRVCSWDDANRWTRRVLAFAEKLPGSDPRRQKLVDAATEFRRNREKCYGGDCVVCGEHIAGQKHHVCDPKLVARREAKAKTEFQHSRESGRTVGVRIGEGFSMLRDSDYESGDT